MDGTFDPVSGELDYEIYEVQTDYGKSFPGADGVQKAKKREWCPISRCNRKKIM